ncbi:predicted protein [Plenodomus lingam JN3]|uniref:Predicted protein n=1 Tax=Leptosphaeria maculans (strain JN3 / isolate v23.1.3 / race Av1-4-5-6-7-8) TaxID=985895 RepID=E4ZLV9_LEPMJ|nr:predicted protein [Plenodomus lingam JN3]CBX92789.1 predicted protein [Plenodomus lingam JN3]
MQSSDHHIRCCIAESLENHWALNIRSSIRKFGYFSDHSKRGRLRSEQISKKKGDVLVEIRSTRSENRIPRTDSSSRKACRSQPHSMKQLFCARFSVSERHQQAVMDDTKFLNLMVSCTELRAQADCQDLSTKQGFLPYTARAYTSISLLPCRYGTPYSISSVTQHGDVEESLYKILNGHPAITGGKGEQHLTLL